MLSQDSEPKRITRLLFAGGCQKKKKMKRALCHEKVLQAAAAAVDRDTL